MVISSGYVDGYALHKIDVEGARKQITLAWSSALATAQRGSIPACSVCVLAWMSPGIRD
jgi:hypothetical protein